MSGSVLGKLAFITGSGSGIGRAVCQVLAREGATIIAADQNVSKAQETIELLETKATSKHNSVHLDVGKSLSVQKALEQVINLHGNPPTVIVNCAGIVRDNFILKLSEQDFDEVINTNLKGTFLVTQAFARAIIEKQLLGGSIINISSFVTRLGNIGQTNYSASKAGVELVTRTAAKELGQFGIRCNTIMPGVIVTPMSDTIPEKVRQKFAASIALKRFGQPQEVAEVIAFLASDRSSYISGATIEVTGGF